MQDTGSSESGGAFAYRQVKRPRSSPGQRVALGLLVLLTVFGIFIAVGSTLYGIKAPFRKTEAEVRKSEELAKTYVAAEGSRDQQKKVDTDGDELTDYDELYAYHTSPYLKDTDSDTYDDKQELTSGHDPNCPEGKTCDVPLLAQTPPASTPSSVPSTTTQELEQQLQELKTLTPTQVRTLLISRGATEEQLKGIDDAVLVDVYKKGLEQAIQQQQSRPAENPVSNQIHPVAQIDPTKLSADDIRELMLKTGKVTQEELAKINDEQLRVEFLKIYTEAAQTFNTSPR